MFLGSATAIAPSAAAQVEAGVSITTDDRFRGASLSQGRPVATFDLSYDDATGVYVAGAATGVATREDGVQLLTFQGNIGYARRLKAGLTIDIGIVHANYTEYFSGGYTAYYDEIYAGFITKFFSSHIHYSPNYFTRGTSAVYVDVDAVTRLTEKWQLRGHAGLLSRSGDYQAVGTKSFQYDWRLGVSTQVKRLDLRLDVVGSGPNANFYDGRLRHDTGIVFSVVRSF